MNSSLLTYWHKQKSRDYGHTVQDMALFEQGFVPARRGPFVSAKGPKTIPARAWPCGSSSSQHRITWLRISLQGLFKKVRQQGRRPREGRGVRLLYVEGCEPRPACAKPELRYGEGRERRWLVSCSLSVSWPPFSTTPSLKQSSPSGEIRRWDSATRRAEHTDSKRGTIFLKPHIFFHRHARGCRRASMTIKKDGSPPKKLRG